MKPADICKNILGKEKIEAILGELTTTQVKAILTSGDIKTKTTGGYVSQNKRRALWGDKIVEAVEQENHDLAAEILQQWLLYHRREMLMNFLDRLHVRHRLGETDDSFLINQPTEKLREAAKWLLNQYDRTETAAYLIYIAYQQQSKAFDDLDELKDIALAASKENADKNNS